MYGQKVNKDENYVSIEKDNSEVIEVPRRYVDESLTIGDSVEIEYRDGHHVVTPLHAKYPFNKTVNGKLKVNKLAYILCAIFLGGFGLHKFLIKQYKLGFLYLIFSWTGITECIGIVEGLMALDKPADKDGNIEFDYDIKKEL